MKAIPFKGQNKILGENVEGITPLPIFVDNNNERLPVVTCWEFDDPKERKKFLRTGKLFITCVTDGNGLSPMYISSTNPIIKKPVTKEEKKEIKKNALKMVSNQMSKKEDEKIN